MVTASTTQRSTSTAARVVITLTGAGLMIVGSFMAWIDRAAGTDLSWKAFYETGMGTSKTFVMTVGAVFILLGLLGVLGLAQDTGGLTRAAGALGIVGWVLVAIELYRARSSDVASVAQRLDAGAWIVLAGAFALLIAGFIGTTRATES
jgi:hypothetical protein